MFFQGGVQTNVVPPELTVAFDCRLSVETDHQEFENWINVSITCKGKVCLRDESC